jgi:hypothetical protein
MKVLQQVEVSGPAKRSTLLNTLHAAPDDWQYGTQSGQSRVAADKSIKSMSMVACQKRQPGITTQIVNQGHRYCKLY